MKALYADKAIFTTKRTTRNSRKAAMTSNFNVSSPSTTSTKKNGRNSKVSSSSKTTTSTKRNGRNSNVKTPTASKVSKTNSSSSKAANTAISTSKRNTRNSNRKVPLPINVMSVSTSKRNTKNSNRKAPISNNATVISRSRKTRAKKSPQVKTDPRTQGTKLKANVTKRQRKGKGTPLTKKKNTTRNTMNIGSIEIDDDESQDDDISMINPLTLQMQKPNFSFIRDLTADIANSIKTDMTNNFNQLASGLTNNIKNQLNKKRTFDEMDTNVTTQVQENEGSEGESYDTPDVVEIPPKKKQKLEKKNKNKSKKKKNSKNKSQKKLTKSSKAKSKTTKKKDKVQISTKEKEAKSIKPKPRMNYPWKITSKEKAKFSNTISLGVGDARGVKVVVGNTEISKINCKKQTSAPWNFRHCEFDKTQDDIGLLPGDIVVGNLSVKYGIFGKAAWRQDFYGNKEIVLFDTNSNRVTKYVHDTCRTAVLHWYMNNGSGKENLLYWQACENLHYNFYDEAQIIEDIQTNNKRFDWEQCPPNLLQYLAGIEWNIHCILRGWLLRNYQVYTNRVEWNHTSKTPVIKMNWRGPDYVMQLNGGVRFRDGDIGGEKIWQHFGYNKFSNLSDWQQIDF